MFIVESAHKLQRLQKIIHPPKWLAIFSQYFELCRNLSFPSTQTPIAKFKIRCLRMYLL